LQTYGDGNDSLLVGDEGTAWPVFNDNGAALGSAPASRVVSMVVVEVGLLSPSSGLAQEGPARQCDGGRLLGNGS
jgi:hypothetical protein